MLKKALVVLGTVVLLGAAFWGGSLYSSSGTQAGPGGFAAADGTRPAGGPMAALTEAEQAELEKMTAQERQEFFQEKMGDSAPAGAPGGMRGGGAIEGEIIEIAGDTITLKTENGSSQRVYTDDDTVIGYAEGTTTMDIGSKVMVIAAPEADGVITASGILVK
ncbi:hypothetical protein EG835_06985 [bacterium]|nr:hypothetical protein [bacterium]